MYSCAHQTSPPPEEKWEEGTLGGGEVGTDTQWQLKNAKLYGFNYYTPLIILLGEICWKCFFLYDCLFQICFFSDLQPVVTEQAANQVDDANFEAVDLPGQNNIILFLFIPIVQPFILYFLMCQKHHDIY